MSHENNHDFSNPNPSQDHHTNATAGIDKLSLGSPRTTNSQHSTPAAHGPLSSDIQARIMAFQQKRANKPPPATTAAAANAAAAVAAQSPSTANVHPHMSDYSSISAPNILHNLSGASGASDPLHDHNLHHASDGGHNNLYNPHDNSSSQSNNNIKPPIPSHYLNNRSLSQNDAAPVELIPSPLPNESPKQREYQFHNGLGSTTPTNTASAPNSSSTSASASHSDHNRGLYSESEFQQSPAHDLDHHDDHHSIDQHKETLQQQAQQQQQQQSSFDLGKKPSLSQRRGMKMTMALNGGSPTTTLPPSDTTNQETNSNTLSSPVNLNYNNDSNGKDAGLSSRRKNKAKLSLNLNDLPNNNASNNSGLSSLSSSSNSSSTNLNSQLNGAQSQAPNAAAATAAGESKKQQLHGLFANYSKYVDIKSGSLNFAGKASLHSKGVDFSSGSSFRISLDELEFLDEIGHGNYGTVSKVIHKPTGVLMAMKEVRLELDETKFTQILMELEILHKCDSPYIVDFYGAFFVEGAVYMCMEYMDGGSLDKIYSKDEGVEDEACLAYTTECVIRGLKELKDEHNIIHRDVKPTNILINTLGKVKLCDFGVSGNLVASLAKTNIGCQSYMAPERIKSVNPDDTTYSIQSDIWSLGLTILEIAAGHYPYPSETYDNIFSQLSAIVDGEPPKLDSKKFSKEAQLFVKSCLNKNPDLRPSYATLLNHPWLVKYRDVDPHMGEIVSAKVQEHEEEKQRKKLSRSNSSKKAPSVASAKKGPVPIAGGGAPVVGNPPARENVHSLLKNKVNAPALHRGGLSGQNRRFR